MEPTNNATQQQQQSLEPQTTPAPAPEATTAPAVQPEVLAPETPQPVAEAVEAAEPEAVDHVAILKPLLDVLSSGQDADDTLVAKVAEELGTQPEIVELLGQGFVAIQEKRVNACYSAAGGRESYQEIVSWAAQGLSQQEAEAFNSVLNKGTVAEISKAVADLKTKFTAVNGSPKVETKAAVGGSGSSTGASTVSAQSSSMTRAFANDSELSAAMRDPRYRTDKSYTDEVYARAYLMGKK